MSDLQFTDPYELAKFIKNATKQTPVKAYISGDLADVKATDIHLFGSNSFYFAVGDAEPIQAFLEKNKAAIKDVYVENDRRNSTLVLWSAKKA